MKILFVAAEADPFIKTGGLGDVAYALPKHLAELGVDVRVVIPKYKNIKDKFKDKIKFRKSFNVSVGWRNQYCGVFDCEVGKVKYYLLDNEYYFLRDDLYGYYDDGEKFAFFDRAVLEMIKELGWKPDIIHCNDWQSGMIPVLYKCQYEGNSFYKNIKTVFSIHNLLFQGNFDAGIVSDLFNLDYEIYNNGSIEFYGAASFMKGALNYSDKISTVSKTYAQEIQTPQYGERMDGLISSRREDLSGILNGIDYDMYNPEKDKYLYIHYNKDSLINKFENKKKLQEELGLKVDESIPIIGIVSRLTSQKGIDLIEYIGDRLIKKNIQLVILGTGNKRYEDYFRYLEDRNKKNVSSNIYFDDVLAHRIYGGSDMFLMPSLFEPCGLGQLIALRYGSVPIVRETGGLRDTIKSYNKFTGEGNGFSFTSYNGDELLHVVEMALSYYEDKEVWNNIVYQAMESDNSWEKSAQVYKKLYESLI